MSETEELDGVGFPATKPKDGARPKSPVARRYATPRINGLPVQSEWCRKYYPRLKAQAQGGET